MPTSAGESKYWQHFYVEKHCCTAGTEAFCLYLQLPYVLLVTFFALVILHSHSNQEPEQPGCLQQTREIKEQWHIVY